MDLPCTKIPLDTIEKCRNLWLLQKKLKELLAKYGNCLETIRINPYNKEARLTILSLIKEISDVGKNQNNLMKEWDESFIEISEKYSSNKSILLENFRDALIRQLWSNGLEQCPGAIDDDIVKILFLNQMNLIPSNLSEYLNHFGNANTESIDIGNLQVCPTMGSFVNESAFNGVDNADANKIHTPDDKPPDITINPEPRCTRSSKPSLKRSNPDDDVITRVKSRRKVTLLTEKPNTCCGICRKLIRISDEEIDDHGKMVSCSSCNDKYYSSDPVTSHSSSNIDDPITPSDLSSQNNTP